MLKSNPKLNMMVGMFVGIGFALFLASIFLIGGEKNLFESTYTISAYFDDISGLRAGAPVQLAGIKIGSVKTVSLAENMDSKKVKVLMAIKKDYQDRIRLDSRAEIVTQGLLGDKMILISLGSSSAAVLEDNQSIEVESSAGMGELFKNGEDVLSHMNETLGKLNDILEEIKMGEGMIHSLIYDPAGKNIVSNLNGLSMNLNQSTYHFNEITRKINDGEGTIGALVNDASLYMDVKTLLGKANRNKIIKAAIRHTLNTREEALIESK